MPSALDHRVDTLGTELYRAVDSSVGQGSSVIRNALDAAAAAEARAQEIAQSDTYHAESAEVWDGDDVEYAIERAEWERRQTMNHRP